RASTTDCRRSDPQLGQCRSGRLMTLASGLRSLLIVHPPADSLIRFDSSPGHLDRADAHVAVAYLAGPRFETEGFGAPSLARIFDLLGRTEHVDAPTRTHPGVERVDLEHELAVEGGRDELLAGGGA